MPGKTLRVVTKQVLLLPEYGGTGDPLHVPIARGIDIEQYREATLMLRFHDGTAPNWGTSGGAVEFSVVAEAPTDEDVAEFVEYDPTSGIPTGIVGLTLSTSPFAAMTSSFPRPMYRVPVGVVSGGVANFGNLGAKLVIAVKSTIPAPITLVLSADIVLKS